MNLNKNYIKKTIFLQKRDKSPFTPISTLDIQDLNFSQGLQKGYFSIPEDMYVNVLLTKTCEIFEYVDTKKDDRIYAIDRQLINPYYINFDFFNTVRRIKVNTSDDLTLQMKAHLQTAYTESIMLYSASTDPTTTWFNEIGYNILVNDIIITVDDVTGLKREENGLERLEKIKKTFYSVVSKAFYFPIDINK